MKAVIDGTILAEAPKDDLISIEGNWYFPPSSLSAELFTQSDTAYHCPWKGDARYFDVVLGDQSRHDLAWSYPEPLPGSRERVGGDYADYVAFDRAVEIVES